jgi:hypothetical protein
MQSVPVKQNVLLPTHNAKQNPPLKSIPYFISSYEFIYFQQVVSTGKVALMV